MGKLFLDKVVRSDVVFDDKGIAGAGLGGKLNSMETLLNELKTNFIALTAQLDADTGVVDTDYGDLDPTSPDIDLDANL